MFLFHYLCQLNSLIFSHWYEEMIQAYVWCHIWMYSKIFLILYYIIFTVICTYVLIAYRQWYFLYILTKIQIIAIFIYCTTIVTYWKTYISTDTFSDILWYITKVLSNCILIMFCNIFLKKKAIYWHVVRNVWTHV